MAGDDDATVKYTFTLISMESAELSDSAVITSMYSRERVRHRAVLLLLMNGAISGASRWTRKEF